MAIVLSPETQSLVEQSMRQGGFPSADDAVRAALALLDRQDPEPVDATLDHSLDEEDLAALNEAEAEIDRGEGIDLDTLRREMAKRFARS